ncbi:hypothetical protein HN587_01510 [Candidatus Woesearchaeota archaeon]|jgi:hypothetical protein|nr:hypothetical protein [Candidatus Woesearchaeota archaeon]
MKMTDYQIKPTLKSRPIQNNPLNLGDVVKLLDQVSFQELSIIQPLLAQYVRVKMKYD